MRFAAIDFETADRGADSACALGVAVVDNGKVLTLSHHLIRPPRRNFEFTYIHGLTWEDVAKAPSFCEVWEEIWPEIKDSRYLLAHNASFDRKVLYECCGSSGQQSPPTPFVCTVKLSRVAWGIRPTKLPDVCRHLNIDLVHHRADSDAHACAQIGLAALRENHSLEMGLLGRGRAAAQRSPTITRHKQGSVRTEGPLPSGTNAAKITFNPDSNDRFRGAGSGDRGSVPPSGASSSRDGSGWTWAVLIGIGLLLLYAFS